MPRHFTPADHQYAVERLIANRGNVSHTASELGIARRTLYRWREESQTDTVTLPPVPPIVPKASPIPTDDADALRNLKARMLDLAGILAASVESAIEEAPLGQRIAGLTQLIDRIIKLAAQLPEEEVQYDLLEGAEDEEPDEESEITESPFRSEEGVEK